jgi:hypothetical protein
MNRREFIKAGGTAAGGTGLTINNLLNRTWTFNFWLNPKEHIDPEATSEIKDINKWTEEEYHYSKDPFFGLYDTTKPVDRFIQDKTGDCDDYSRFALSWLVYRDKPAYLVFVVTGRWTLHLFVHDGIRAYDDFGVGNIGWNKDDAIFWREKKVNDGTHKQVDTSTFQRD